jgi:putative transposase
LKPVEERELVAQLQKERGLSQRRAVRLLRCNRKTARYTSCRSDDAPLRERLKMLAHQNLKWGYKLLWATLRQEGWIINHKKVYRLYKEERLELRQKGKKRLKSEGRGLPEVASTANEEWALDFVHDALCDGRSFRTLNVIDAFTRQCLHIECDTSRSSERVVRVLEQLRVQRGKPQRLRIDNGPEFRSKNLDLWAKEHGVVLFFIEAGKPTQNGQIESFNGRFRAECLDQEWFTSLSNARNLIEVWRRKYNTLRPHSSLGYLPPNTWARKLNLSPNLIYC